MMQNDSWFWATTALLLAYAALILFFVVRGARRTRSLSDYAVGSTGFSPVIVGLSLAASITSAATFIINPGFIALFGWSAFLAFAVVLPIGLYLSLIVLTKSFRRYGSSVKAVTMAQWMGARYESKGFAFFFAVLSLLLLSFIVLICVGMTKVLAQALGMSETPVLIGLVVFVFGYMMFGGANSMVYTNTIQALVMLVVAVMMLGSGYEHFSEGIRGFWDKIAAIDPALTQSFNAKSPVSRDFIEVVLCNFVVGVAVVCQPHIITRSLMLRSEKDVNRYLLVGILAETLFFIVVFTGFYARLMFPELKIEDGSALKMDAITSAYVVREFPVWAGLIVILGLISAGLSTLEGLIQSLSTTITQDILKPVAGSLFRQEQRQIWIQRGVIAVLAVLAIAISKWQMANPTLSVGIFAQNGVYAFFSAAFVPVLLGIFTKNTPKIAAIAASVTAIIVHFGTYYGGMTTYLQGPVRNPAVAATMAILSALAVGLILHFAFRKKAVPVLATLVLLLAGSVFANAQTSPMDSSEQLLYATLPDGKKIAYTDSGTGAETLVFVHGLGSNHKSWRKNIPVLQEKARCISLDLPGYGQSDKGDWAYDMQFFAQTLHELLDVLQLEQVTLVGHSMGGQISMHFALMYPEKVKNLVLLAPAGFEIFTEAERAWFGAVYTPQLLKATPPEQIRKNFAMNFVSFPADAEFMIADRMALRDSEAYDPYCAMIPKCVMGMLQQPVFERLPEIKTRTLVLYGEQDYLIPNRFLHKQLSTAEVARSGQERLPDSRLQMVPDAGHFVQWEGADAVNAAVLDFIK